MMPTKVKEKIELLRKDVIECHELIINFKNSLRLWFIYGTSNNTILKEVLNSCAEIIVHGLKEEGEKLQTVVYYDSSPTASNGSTNTKNNINKVDNSDLILSELHKIIDDFEWVRNAVSIRLDSSPRKVLCKETITSSWSLLETETFCTHLTITSLVKQWVNHNIGEQNLCGFIQYLVNDKELLEEHYSEEALLRQEKYVTILVIGLTAFETQQYGLLTQIDTVLDVDITKAHKRSNSQPNFIIVPKKSNSSHFKSNTANTRTSQNQNYSTLILSTIRKTKSLPVFISKRLSKGDAEVYGSLNRSRCKTFCTFKHRTSPQYIPKAVPQSIQSVNFNSKSNDTHVPTSLSGSFFYDYNDNLPSTSQTSSNRSKSPLSNYTLNSNTPVTPSLMSTSASSFNSNNTTKCIQLINTDNIKIWTDHSWEMKKESTRLELQKPITASCAIPAPLATTAKPCKSFSPLNNFFSSLFSTPPSYTSWFVDHEALTEQETTETAIESTIPSNNSFNNRHFDVMTSLQQPSLSRSSTVFDKFLPIDGKKLRSRKSQNLFDDVDSTLECSSINKLVSVDNVSTESPSTSLSPGCISVRGKNQSLTRFLQMSNLSRNNTDLEKENAHFRISEAIISAIEHIKWNKLETQKIKTCCEATPLATDCLASSSNPQQNSSVIATSSDIDREHIPYAELEEVSYEQLSAEVVGLSLISKFDETQVPKVSELKWLVSDDDTPQNLLPMPDLTSSANPDDHVIHSATRGTRYWAPPRPQIIFTDHPPPNRKQLLKKQNNRCAGCGMRVSPEYMQSFRYCTYLGKYHCTGCHRNQISATPAKILQAWDFKCYPVSVFAYRLLEQMYAYPLFYVPDLNPALYIRCKPLLSARNKRFQLKFVKDFIRMCRFALREQTYFNSVPDYITADIDNWSMSDFIDARTKCLHRSIDELIMKCENHIFNCVLCTARGFLCEYCDNGVVIYPWSSCVERCDRCGTCFHRNCWKSMSEKCCRCQRLDKRQNEINDVI